MHGRPARWQLASGWRVSVAEALMTTFRPKLWTSAGAALLLGLSACGNSEDAADTDAAAPEAPAATSGERGQEGGATAADRPADGALEDASGQRGDQPQPVGEGGEGGGEGGGGAGPG
jgi:hypothetical protein